VLEDAAKVAGVGSTVLIDDGAEDQDFTVAEDVGGDPVEGAPVNAEAKVGLFLGGKAAEVRFS